MKVSLLLKSKGPNEKITHHAARRSRQLRGFMIGKTKIALFSVALGVTGMFASPASAAFDFAGKQITIVIGYGFGGTYGKYSEDVRRTS